MKKLLIIFLSFTLITGCGSVKLTNGEEAIVSFKDGEGITANELYEEIKEVYGVEYLVNLIDTKLLEMEYDETDEEREYIDQIISAVKSESGDDFLSQIEYYYGVTSEKAFKEYIRLNYRRSSYIEDYAASIVTNKQIEEYYNTVAVGDMQLSHILITSDATDSMTSDEKKVAETEAYNKAKDVITRLNNGEDFATLAKELSEDTGSASNGGELGKVNYGMNYDEDFVDGAVLVAEGKYSTTPVKTQFGYHIIYKTKQHDKKDLDEIKDEIRDIIAKENLSSNSNLYLEALENLRNEYEMNIVDSELNKGYENYISEIKTGN